MDNAEIPATPSVAPVKLDWRPLSTVVPAIVAIVASAAVGFLVFMGLDYIFPQADKCTELVLLICYNVNMLIAAAASVIVFTSISYKLLHKNKVGHALAISLLALVTSLLVGTALNSYAGISVWLNLLLSSVIAVGLFVFYDWYVNIFKAGWLKKSLAIASVLSILIALNMLKVDIAGMYKSAGTYSLASSLQKSPMTILVPPPNSDQPQPSSITANTDTTQLYKQDYNRGLYLKMNTSSGEEVTMYEYAYAGPADPTSDCGNLYIADNQNNGSTSQPDCQLITTLPSGNKIYSNNSYMGQYFTVKNDTIAYVNKARSMTESDIYAFLDQLEPLVVDAFMKTLHEQDPKTY